jgi:hypothetical protein
MDLEENTRNIKLKILCAYERMRVCLNSPPKLITSNILNLHERYNPPETNITELWQDSVNELSDHWSKILGWSCEQATALSLGIDPKLIERIRDKRKRYYVSKGQAYDIMPYYHEIFKEFFTDELTEEYLDRHQIFGSKFKLNLHPPTNIIEWAAHRGIVFLEELRDKVKKCSGDPTDWKKECEKKSDTIKMLLDYSELMSKSHVQDKCIINDQLSLQKTLNKKQREVCDELLKKETMYLSENKHLTDELQKYKDKNIHPKERSSLYKMIAAMGVGGYGHDFNAEKSPTVTSILEDLLKIGLSLDEDTIRKHLKEAGELIPGDAIDQNIK